MKWPSRVSLEDPKHPAEVLKHLSPGTLFNGWERGLSFHTEAVKDVTIFKWLDSTKGSRGQTDFRILLFSRTFSISLLSNSTFFDPPHSRRQLVEPEQQNEVNLSGRRPPTPRHGGERFSGQASQPTRLTARPVYSGRAMAAQQELQKA